MFFSASSSTASSFTGACANSDAAAAGPRPTLARISGTTSLTWSPSSARMARISGCATALSHGKRFESVRVGIVSTPMAPRDAASCSFRSESEKNARWSEGRFGGAPLSIATIFPCTSIVA